MKICFLDNTNFQYNSRDLYSKKLRGAESILINLSKALNESGNQVTILNNCPENEIIDNINWININYYNQSEYFDIVFSNNDIQLFDKIISKKKILISHSLQSIEKFIRKSQLYSYIKHKPKILLLSNYHKKNRSKLITFFGKIECGWAVDDIFIKSKLDITHNKEQAIFTSRFDRNGQLLLDIWNNYIQPKNKNLKLLVTPKITNNTNPNIIERFMGTQKQLINDLLNSRILLIPGHKAELYCLAAEEGRELCIPIVTLGIGSLKERVIHGKTGLIAKDKKEFANYTLEIFSNDNLWNELRNNLIMLRNNNNWAKVSKKILNSI